MAAVALAWMTSTTSRATTLNRWLRRSRFCDRVEFYDKLNNRRSQSRACAGSTRRGDSGVTQTQTVVSIRSPLATGSEYVRAGGRAAHGAVGGRRIQ